VNSRELDPPSEKHKLDLIGDSNIRGYVHRLQSLLNINYELYSVIKPGATANELKQTAKAEIVRLSFKDVILISYGTNYYDVNKFSITRHKIIVFIQRNNQTYIILMNLLYRYDLPSLVAINRKITTLNRKLKKSIKAFSTHLLYGNGQY
jgi:hypothetical protein